MRNIVDVINKMKPYITEEKVIKTLDKIIDDSCYKAPELHYELWNKLGFWLNAYYPVPLKNDNQVKIVSIFTTMSEEDVRKNFC